MEVRCGDRCGGGVPVMVFSGAARRVAARCRFGWGMKGATNCAGGFELPMRGEDKERLMRFDCVEIVWVDALRWKVMVVGLAAPMLRKRMAASICRHDISVLHAAVGGTRSYAGRQTRNLQ